MKSVTKQHVRGTKGSVIDQDKTTYVPWLSRFVLLTEQARPLHFLINIYMSLLPTPVCACARTRVREGVLR